MKAKTLLLLLIVSMLVISCKKDDPFKGLNPDSMLALNAPQTVKAEADVANPEHLTPLEIVQQASVIVISKSAAPWGLEEFNRDYERIRIVLKGFNVVNENGELVDLFIGSRDVILESWTNWGTPQWDANNYTRDTIAYIPNSILEKAQQEIEAAYQDEDYAACYKLFEEAYTFYPITGAEWRALKESRNQ